MFTRFGSLLSRRGASNRFQSCYPSKTTHSVTSATATTASQTSPSGRKQEGVTRNLLQSTRQPKSHQQPHPHPCSLCYSHQNQSRPHPQPHQVTTANLDEWKKQYGTVETDLVSLLDFYKGSLREIKHQKNLLSAGGLTDPGRMASLSEAEEALSENSAQAEAWLRKMRTLKEEIASNSTPGTDTLTARDDNCHSAAAFDGSNTDQDGYNSDGTIVDDGCPNTGPGHDSTRPTSLRSCRGPSRCTKSSEPTSFRNTQMKARGTTSTAAKSMAKWVKDRGFSPIAMRTTRSHLKVPTRGQAPA